MTRFLVSLTILLLTASAFGQTREEALDFLYSIMSLPDRADYSRDFYERNVDASLKAQAEMPWGNKIPRREFMHFVLPVRVNNEHLDDSRMVFYNELKNRVKELSMKDAILEVNHWCHEKVTYRPSDSRTSSPLSSVSQAIGRCGEESTFTVAALRSVGIPARQIYTPRWAHTDDNHAWVEAWADGKWYFLGACEPEPVLNLAWFNDPASRGLLMNTNVAGLYDGPEEILLQEPLTTRINVTSNYAPTGKIHVRVVSKDGNPVKDATVNFCIYNYAEFYPAATKTSSSEGQASLLCGLGDMLIWATDGHNFGFAKGNPKDQNEVVVTLDHTSLSEGSFSLDVIPPVAGAEKPFVSDQQRTVNNLRFQKEDSIRNAYSSTFVSEIQAADIANQLGLDVNLMKKILPESRGNHTAIVEILKKLQPNKRELALRLLAAVSEKDRRDIPTEIIYDVIENTLPVEKTIQPGISIENYDRYVLSPRIEAEFLYPWRKKLSSSLPVNLKGATPEKLVKWVEANISLADAENPQKLRMSPIAVMNERKADKLSRDIFFVAAARTLGIPARIDPVTGTKQVLKKDESWQIVKFSSETEDEKTSDVKTGKLKLTFTPQGHIVDPKYYSQFSISRIIDGVPRQLGFDEESTLSSIFKDPVDLEAGQYLLVSGQRLANGGVLAQCELFMIEPDETLERELNIRQDERELSVIGSLNAENIYHDLNLDIDKNILSTTGRGYYIWGLLSPNHEPSTHALNDLSAVAKQLEGSGMKIMLMFDDKEAASRFKKDTFPGLPQNVVFGIDNGNISKNEILSSLHMEEAINPIFVVTDTFNRVVWVSTGYTIGIGEQLLNVISRLK